MVLCACTLPNYPDSIKLHVVAAFHSNILATYLPKEFDPLQLAAGGVSLPTNSNHSFSLSSHSLYLSCTAGVFPTCHNVFIAVHKHIRAPSACNLHCVEVVVVPAVHA